MPSLVLTIRMSSAVSRRLQQPGVKSDLAYLLAAAESGLQLHKIFNPVTCLESRAHVFLLTASAKIEAV